LMRCLNMVFGRWIDRMDWRQKKESIEVELAWVGDD